MARLLRVLAVATLATVVERETQAEQNAFLGAFVDVCCRQVVLVIIGGWVRRGRAQHEERGDG